MSEETQKIKTAMKANELEALIMERIKGCRECNDIVGVKVRRTGFRPPRTNWSIAKIERDEGPPSHTKSNAMFFGIIKDLHEEVELSQGSE